MLRLRLLNSNLISASVWISWPWEGGCSSKWDDGAYEIPKDGYVRVSGQNRLVVWVWPSAKAASSRQEVGRGGTTMYAGSAVIGQAWLGVKSPGSQPLFCYVDLRRHWMVLHFHVSLCSMKVGNSALQNPPPGITMRLSSRLPCKQGVILARSVSS